LPLWRLAELGHFLEDGLREELNCFAAHAELVPVPPKRGSGQ
jgi:hypothetical protein